MPLTASMLVAMLAGAIWAYWPGLVEIVGSWNRDPDYSHGYLVLPLAGLFLWVRRSQLDAGRLTICWHGLVLLLTAVGLRVISGWYFLGPVDAWTLPLTVAGIVLLLFGWHALKWSLPSIAFLYFMIPIPYSAETWLSVPLQRVATAASTEALQLLGQPAMAEGNVIWLEEEPLFIAEACSGLRILVGILALAFAYVLFTRWSYWQKALVLLAAIPVALFANMVRIVTTGLLFRLVSGEAAHRFSHDLAGFVMIPFAAIIFWLLLIYLERLFPKVQVLSPAAIVGGGKSR